MGFSTSVEGTVVRVVFPEHYSFDELEGFLDEFMIRVEAVEAPGVLLVDVRAVAQSRRHNRKRFAAFITAQDEYLATRISRMAIVAGSALQRGAITAFLWLKPMRWPTKVFADIVDAERWLEEA